MVEDGLDVLHGEPGLIGDADRVPVLAELVRVLVVKRGGRGARDEEQVARCLDADGRSVGHVLDAFRYGLNFAE